MKALWKIELAIVSCLLLTASACSDGDDEKNPTDVDLGDTAIVAVVNPPLNEINSATIPTPGSQRSGLKVALDDNPAVSSDTYGIAVLSDLTAGTGPLKVGDGSVNVTLVDRELRELAIASAGNSTSIMADARYQFASMEVVEIDAGMTTEQVNSALNGSNRIVLVHGATYQGKVVFNGSNVTLFGEGAKGGQVTFAGDVEVNGSGNRMRGAHIKGNLLVDGSGFAMTFTTVDGVYSHNGSDAILLLNTFCKVPEISGGNLKVLGNAGLAPLSVPTGACP